MKDVAGCDKPRGAAKQASIRGFPNGETHCDKLTVLNYVGFSAVTLCGAREDPWHHVGCATALNPAWFRGHPGN